MTSHSPDNASPKNRNQVSKTPDPLTALKALPPDAILSVAAGFEADPRTDIRINAGTGVIADPSGRVEQLPSVKRAERLLGQSPESRGYLATTGRGEYASLAAEILLGRDSRAIAEHRVAAVHTLGGTGALHVLGQLLRRSAPNAPIAISNPSWDNHQRIFKGVGFELLPYHPVDITLGEFDLGRAVEDLSKLPRGSVVVMHMCCHNPTGVDPSDEQLEAILDAVASNNLFPLVDAAYQGFRSGMDADAHLVRRLVERGIPFCAALSHSKNAAMYRERCGVAVVVGSTEEAANISKQHLGDIARGIYSSPSNHGPEVMEKLLGIPELREAWMRDVNELRLRLDEARTDLARELGRQGADRLSARILRQSGMFCHLGFSPQQMGQLAKEFAIHGVRSGRIAISNLHAGNIPHVALALSSITERPFNS